MWQKVRVSSSPYQSIFVQVDFPSREGGNQGVATGKKLNDFKAVSGRACPGHPDNQGTAVWRRVRHGSA
jgi:hypothetical protein